MRTARNKILVIRQLSGYAVGTKKKLGVISVRKQPRTLLIGGTQAASGKSLLTLAFANVLVDQQLSVTIIECQKNVLTWTRISHSKRHQWQTDVETAEQLETCWFDLQTITTDYLLIDLQTTGAEYASETWLLNNCWLPLADQVILTYAATTDVNNQLFEDLGRLQFSMEYTNSNPQLYTVFNEYAAKTPVAQTIAVPEMGAFHREFFMEHAEFVALDVQPLGRLRNARQRPQLVLADAEDLLSKLKLIA